MQTDDFTLHQHEWMTLQNQSDSYEKFSLLIKLLNVVLACLLLFSLDVGMWTLFIVAIMWLQDGIWKTYQERINQRILAIEAALLTNEADIKHEAFIPMQFNRTWLANRQSAKGLVAEYITTALKPTVAYPHILLIFLCIGHCFAV